MPTEDARTENPGEILPDEVTVWVATCPQCGEVHLTMLTREKTDGGPWKEIVAGVTEISEEDYYCEACRSFVNLKEANVWEKAQA